MRFAIVSSLRGRRFSNLRVEKWCSHSNPQLAESHSRTMMPDILRNLCSVSLSGIDILKESLSTAGVW